MLMYSFPNFIAVPKVPLIGIGLVDDVIISTYTWFIFHLAGIHPLNAT